MTRKTVFTLSLDAVMLVLVCVLESVALTGLELHEWLGFALLGLVLVHVGMQWPWLVTQTPRIWRGGARVRVNVVLNGLLLLMMSGVLVSGALESSQLVPLLGERLGSVHVWREVHGWLNFTAVVLVALHLALNWDWVRNVGWRSRVRTVTVAELGGEREPGGVAARRWTKRGMAALLAVVLSAGVVYHGMKPLLRPAARPRRNGPALLLASEPGPAERLVPAPRPANVREGLQHLDIACGVVIFTVLVGRYVLRLRL